MTKDRIESYGVAGTFFISVMTSVPLSALSLKLTLSPARMDFSVDLSVTDHCIRMAGM